MAIVGLGLIGGSLARALSSAGYRVLGVDRPQVARQARRAQATSGTATLAEAARTADVIVLAAPPEANVRLLRLLAREMARAATAGRRRPAWVTDVGSVKQPIVQEAARLGLTSFVGGHPLAGTERSGFAASRSDLFSGWPWLLTPRAGQPVPVELRRMVRAAGGRLRLVAPADHDRALAFLSHLPQLVAWALLAAAEGDSVTRGEIAVAGPGFRGMTRLARSPRPLWRQILGQNAREVRRAMAALQVALRAELRKALP